MTTFGDGSVFEAMIPVDNIILAKNAVEELFGITLIEHESSYYGHPYYLCKRGDETFYVKINQDDEGQPLVSQFAAEAIIFQVVTTRARVTDYEGAFERRFTN